MNEKNSFLQCSISRESVLDTSSNKCIVVGVKKKACVFGYLTQLEEKRGNKRVKRTKSQILVGSKTRNSDKNFFYIAYYTHIFICFHLLYFLFFRKKGVSLKSSRARKKCISLFCSFTMIF